MKASWLGRTIPNTPRTPTVWASQSATFSCSPLKSRLRRSNRCLAQPALASSTRGSPIPGKRLQNRGRDLGPINPPHTELAPDAQGRSPKDGEMLTRPNHIPSCHPDPCTEPPTAPGCSLGRPQPRQTVEERKYQPAWFLSLYCWHQLLLYVASMSCTEDRGERHGGGG